MTAGGPLGGRDVPGWLTELALKIETWAPIEASRPTASTESTDRARSAAVLILFGSGPDGPDVLLLERASDLRDHAGQPAFPGGATDPTDASPVETALREAQEEVGLDPACVHVLTNTGPLYLRPSNYLVTPVLAWWHSPHPVEPVDPAETAAVARVPVAELADPANRLLLRHPMSGYVGPAFRVRGMLVWGFTAALLDALLTLGAWERPWIEDAPVDDELLASLVPGKPRNSASAVGADRADHGPEPMPGPVRE
jgi:8-oxo-dGTP pyrophosphatase MutT (NUDIX family)